MYNFNEMLLFVKKTLEDANAVKSPNPKHHFRNRFDHSRRVLGWCKRIVTDLPVDKDVLYTAAIFHDVGYAKGKGAHASASAEIFKEFAKERSFPEDFIERVAASIAVHSDKHLLGTSFLSNEDILLMEADLLDEEGALGFVWDFMAIANDPGVDYYDSLDAMCHSMHILDQDYMITPLAKKYWEEKKELVRIYSQALKSDLFVGEE